MGGAPMLLPDNVRDINKAELIYQYQYVFLSETVLKQAALNTLPGETRRVH